MADNKKAPHSKIAEQFVDEEEAQVEKTQEEAEEEEEETTSSLLCNPDARDDDDKKEPPNKETEGEEEEHQQEDEEQEEETIDKLLSNPGARHSSQEPNAVAGRASYSEIVSEPSEVLRPSGSGATSDDKGGLTREDILDAVEQDAFAKRTVKASLGLSSNSGPSKPGAHYANGASTVPVPGAQRFSGGSPQQGKRQMASIQGPTRTDQQAPDAPAPDGIVHRSRGLDEESSDSLIVPGAHPSSGPLREKPRASSAGQISAAQETTPPGLQAAVSRAVPGAVPLIGGSQELNHHCKKVPSLDFFDKNKRKRKDSLVSNSDPAFEDSSNDGASPAPTQLNRQDQNDGESEKQGDRPSINPKFFDSEKKLDQSPSGQSIMVGTGQSIDQNSSQPPSIRSNNNSNNQNNNINHNTNPADSSMPTYPPPDQTLNLVEAELVQERSERNMNDTHILVPAVEVDPEAQDHKPIYQHKQFAYVAAGGLCLCCVIIIIVVAVVLATSGGSDGGESSKDNSPTPAPSTAAPTGTSPDYEIIEQNMAALLDDPSQLQNETSPYYKALNWLAYVDGAPADRKHIEQRYLMAVFYYMTSVQYEWVACTYTTWEDTFCDHPEYDKDTQAFVNVPETRWLSKTSECAWAGLGCHNDDDSMKRIELDTYGLNGILLPELGKLPRLSTLELKDNPDLKGTIPEGLGTDQLELHKLFLQRNGFTGTLSDNICNATDMKEVELSSNYLEGTIPDCLWKYHRVEKLNFDGNAFTGSIPSEIGLLEKLEEAHFNDNDLSGEVPLEVCLLSQGVLTELKIDCNDDDIDNYVSCNATVCNCDCS